MKFKMRSDENRHIKRRDYKYAGNKECQSDWTLNLKQIPVYSDNFKLNHNLKTL